MHIFLIGFMGTGKSTVAKELKKITNLPLIDTDARIVENSKMSIPMLFEKYGEDGFRDIETDNLKAIANDKASIVSCGGGIILRSENISIMQNSGKIIWLTASGKNILARVKNDSNRPLLKDKKNSQDIEQMMNKRAPLYESAADYTVSTDDKKPAQIAREICDLVDL